MGKKFPKVSIVHIETCLPDYFPGDSRPWVCIPAYRRTFASIRRDLENEVRQGMVVGSDTYARLLRRARMLPEEEIIAEKLMQKVCAAIRRDVRPAKKGERIAFRDIELPEYGDCVMAYFAIVVEQA